MVQIDIDMPENCIECPIHDGEYGRCNVNKNISVNFEERPRKCPLIEPEQEEYEKSYKKGYYDGFVDADKLKRCRFEYINACKIVAHPTTDTSKNDIYDAYAVIKALQPIFGDEEF